MKRSFLSLLVSILTSLNAQAIVCAGVPTQVSLDNLFKFLFLFLPILFINPAFSQSPPSAVQEMLDQAKGKVTYIENISPSQRAFFMQNKTIDKSGVMLFKADKRLLYLVDQFEKESIRRNGEKKIHPQCNIKFFNKNLYLQTPLEENDARTSWAYHFDEMNFGNLGFMKWDLRKSEARVVLVKEFVNIPIDNVMGTFSFLYSETMPFSLWTVSWIKDEIEYEFHAEDKTKNLTSFEGRKNVVRDLALNFKKALCL